MPTSNKMSEITTIEIIPIPEIGLDDDPTKPAIYPHAAATKKPMIKVTAVQTNTRSHAKPAGKLASATN